MASLFDSVPLRAPAFNTDRSRISDRVLTPQPSRKPLAMRKYQIASLLPDGQVRHSDQIGPAMPLFESAFSAFAHGTLINTSNGQVAVEDLLPGMKIMTADRGPRQLLWIGSMTMVPKAGGVLPQECRLTRLMTDSFGMGRPQRDLMVGPAARLLMHNSRLEQTTGEDHVLTPAQHLVDGMNVIDILPQSPVTVYHLCLRRHAIIRAGGLEVESFHPGQGFERNMGQNMLSLFLSFFPHIREPRDFGPLAAPRLPLGKLPDMPETHVA